MNGLLRVPGARYGLVLLFISTLAACSDDRPPVKGFVLPEGDIEQGKAAFLSLGCPQCHTVADSDIEQPENAEFQVRLGGRLIQVEHYGDLLTSIVNPSHRVAPQLRRQDDSGNDEGAVVSPMPDFTGTMTVTQLIDVVEFLHSKYTQVPKYSGRYYHYPI
ncbi:c-type cytochrome [Chromatocurvus halotolerans]|nr:c-type cytochrome [Chromatocurvus halotolerans]